MLYASHSIFFSLYSMYGGGASVLSGDVGVEGLGSYSGPRIDSLYSATVVKGTTRADSVSLGYGQFGDIYTNHLADNYGLRSYLNPPSFPLTSALPSLPPTAPVTPGNSDVTVDASDSKGLAAGAYANVSVGENATLLLAGGVYDLANLTLQAGATISIGEGVELRIAGRFNALSGNHFIRADESPLRAPDLRIQVSGGDAQGAAFYLGPGGRINALVLVPNGFLVLDSGVLSAHGAFFGRDILTGAVADISIEDGFCTTPCPGGDICNGPQVYNPQTGACQVGPQLWIPDNDPCTVDGCDPQTGVFHVQAAAGASCFGADACNGAGVCNAAGSCVIPRVAAGTPCADATICQEAGTCDGRGGCVQPALVGQHCADAYWCIGEGLCDASGACVQNTLPVGTVCAPASGCIGAGHCNSNGTCDYQLPAPAGTISVASDSCHGECVCDGSSYYCYQSPLPSGTSCGDPNPCRQQDSCDGFGSCDPGPQLPLDDENICTVDACDPQHGLTHAPIAGCDPATVCRAAAAYTLYADNSLSVEGDVFGSVGVRQTGPGDTLFPGFRLEIGETSDFDDATHIHGHAAADPVTVQGTAFAFDLYTNSPIDSEVPIEYHLGSTFGYDNFVKVSPLSATMPQLPPIATPQPGTLDVTVDSFNSLSLAPGSYQDLVVNSYARLTLQGGAYEFRNVQLGDNAHLSVATPAQMHIAGRLYAGDGVFVNAEVNANTPSNLRIEVSGTDAVPLSALQSLIEPVSAGVMPTDTFAFYQGSNRPTNYGFLNAIVVVPNGSLILDPVYGNGAYYGKDVFVSGQFTFGDGVCGNTCPTTNLCEGIRYYQPVVDNNVPGATALFQLGQCVTIPPPPLDDNDSCTADVCDPVAGFSHSALPDYTDCPEPYGDPCRTSACFSGHCVSSPKNISDNSLCTVDSCDFYTGVISHTPIAGFDDGDVCTTDSCDPQTGQITHVGRAVDDGNPCTDDLCDAVSGAIAHVPVTQGTACSDGNACNGLETCDGLGSCLAGTIDDGNACTTDRCDSAGNVSHVLISNCTPPVPDPATVAPPLGQTSAGNLPTSDSFLYQGQNREQFGVVGQFDARLASVLRGRVQTCAGAPVADVKLRVAGHDEWGYTWSRADGGFDLMVTGGAPITVRYEKAGWLTADRQIVPAIQDYVWLPDVDLALEDSPPATVGSGEFGYYVVRSTALTDVDGTRTTTLLFPPKPGSTVVLGQALDTTGIDVIAQEYTDAACGKAALPADLPPTSGYGYAGEFRVVTDYNLHLVTLPIVYLENFLGLPVGTRVPAAYYDRGSGGPSGLAGDASKSAWIPAVDGRVIQILAIDPTGFAHIDIDGDGNEDGSDALDEIGLGPYELTNLASLYAAGQTVWRVPITKLGTWTFSWPFNPPSGAQAPRKSLEPQFGIAAPAQTTCSGPNCNVACLPGTRTQLAIPGTPFHLAWQNDRAAGRARNGMLELNLTDRTPPPGLKRVDLEVMVAGNRFKQSYPPLPVESTTFTWDGRDAYGRRLSGNQPVTVRIGYAYDGEYQQPAAFVGQLPPSAFGGPTAPNPTFAALSGLPLPHSTTRNQVVLWQELHTTIGAFDDNAFGLGGWDLDALHSYDAAGRTLYLGDGTERAADAEPPILTTVVGDRQLPGSNNVFAQWEGRPARSAFNSFIESMTVGPDGSLYLSGTFDNAVANYGQGRRIVRVAPDGIMHTFAGKLGYSATLEDGSAATSTYFESISGMAVAPDGSFYVAVPEPNYVAHDNSSRIRKIGADGKVSTIIGGQIATACYGGHYISETHCTLVVVPPRVITGIDGIPIRTEPGYSYNDCVTNYHFVNTYQANDAGDGNLAILATVGAPTGMAVAPDGTIYFGDTVAGGSFGSGTRIRRIGTDGLVSPLAGDDPCGGGGRQDPVQLLNERSIGDLKLGPDGSLYTAHVVSDFDRLHLWSRVERIGFDGSASSPAIDFVFPGLTVVDTSGDGGPAAFATYRGLRVVEPLRDGSLLVEEDAGAYYASRLRRIDPTGVVRAYAGKPPIGYASQSPPGDGDGGPATEGTLRGVYQVVQGVDGSVYVNENQQSVRRIDSALPRFQLGETQIASSDGTQRYVFSQAGRHLRTVDAATGATTWSFYYDPQGRVSLITDSSGRSTTFTRDTAGKLAAIVAADGTTTHFLSDGAGRLAEAMLPDGTSVSLQYEQGCSVGCTGQNCVAGIDGGARCNGVVIDDGNPCTTDSCDASLGATHAPVVAGTLCADDDLCTAIGSCDAAGHCVQGAPIALNDRNPCTADLCDPHTGVVRVNLPVNSPCINGCAGSGTCNGTGFCRPDSYPTGDDNDPCTYDYCDQSTGVASHTTIPDCPFLNAGQVACDDGNPCTIDDFDFHHGCVHPSAGIGAPCSNGNHCQTTGTCDAQDVCHPGSDISVDDGDPCTADHCDVATGLVTNTPIPNCTEPAQQVAACDDGNDCTTDRWDPVGGCQHASTSVSIRCGQGDDGRCTDHVCNSYGQCVPVVTANADDGNPCTADTCQDGTPHYYALPAGTSCGIHGESCDGNGTCGLHPNPCQAIANDPVQGLIVVAVAAGVSCGDGYACNGIETCDGRGTCLDGKPPGIAELDDGDPCTADGCRAADGIYHEAVSAGTACYDGNPCDQPSSCTAAGVCPVSSPRPVDDGNPCTIDSCTASGNTAFINHIAAPAGTSCSDGNACNGAETCNATAYCRAGIPLKIDDGDPSTVDSCEPATGAITHTKIQDCNLISCPVFSHCDTSSFECTCDPGTVALGDGCWPQIPGASSSHTVAEVCGAWRSGHRLSDPQPWTPGAGACDPGTLSRNGVLDTLNRLAMYRWLVGEVPVQDDPTRNGLDMSCAVVRAKNPTEADPHHPQASWACYSADASTASASSSIFDTFGDNVLVTDAAAAVDGYLEDAGANNVGVYGHRRIAILPKLGPVGVGFYYSPMAAAQCLWQSGDAPNAPSLPPLPRYTWPPAGFVPVEATRWTWTYSTSHAQGYGRAPVMTVIRESDGAILTTTAVPLPDGYGDAAVAFNRDGWDPVAGETYHVRIDQIPGGALIYDVTPVDCGVGQAGPGLCAAGAWSSCSDGNPCNGEETCDDHGACTTGATLDLDDGNPCTADSCDVLLGAIHTPIAVGTLCTDGNLCDGAGTCDASAICRLGAPPVVDDNNPCTADSCEPSTGVVTHAPVPAGQSLCTDGNDCNGIETCNGAGGCQANPPQFDDDNPCTIDDCIVGVGIRHRRTAAGTNCDDGNACNGVARCNAHAVCVAGAAPNIDDGNPCTDDVCDPNSGSVTHSPVAAGTLCATGRACDARGWCPVGPLAWEDKPGSYPTNPPAPPEPVVDLPQELIDALPKTSAGLPILLQSSPMLNGGKTSLGLALDKNRRDAVTRWAGCIGRVTGCVKSNGGSVAACVDLIERCPAADGTDNCCPQSCIDEFHQKLQTGLHEFSAIRESFIYGSCVPVSP